MQRPKEKQWVMDKLLTALVAFLPTCSEMMEPILLQLGGNWYWTFLRESPHSQFQRHTLILYVGRMLWLLGINIVVGEVCFLYMLRGTKRITTFQSFGLFITLHSYETSVVIIHIINNEMKKLIPFLWLFVEVKKTKKDLVKRN